MPGKSTLWRKANFRLILDILSCKHSVTLYMLDTLRIKFYLGKRVSREGNSAGSLQADHEDSIISSGGPSLGSP